MTRATVHIDELPPETKNLIRKRLKADRDTLTRAAVAVLAALDQNGLNVKEWSKVLDLVKRWLKV